MIVHIGQHSVEGKRIEQEPEGKAMETTEGYAYGHPVWPNHQLHIVLIAPFDLIF